MLLLTAKTELDKLTNWGGAQLDAVLYIIMFVLLIYFAFKRAWIMLFTTILALAFIAVFVSDPTMLIKLAEWLAQKLKSK